MRTLVLVAALGISAALASCKGGLSDPAPPAPPGPAAHAQPPATVAGRVDALLRARWQAGGVTPAPRVDDAGWLRRVHLDLAGTLPSPTAVRAFLADGSADKRARAVDALLSSPAYAERWTAYWERELLGPDARSPFVDRTELRRWLREAFVRNAPWNAMATELVSAVGTNSPDGDDRSDVNGAVNWLLRYQRSPADLAGQVSRVMLGVQIQCAQCHDHKTEKWTQDDFQRFAAFFARTRPEPVDTMTGMRIRRVSVQDGDKPAPAMRRDAELRRAIRLEPRTLDGTELEALSRGLARGEAPSGGLPPGEAPSGGLPPGEAPSGDLPPGKAAPDRRQALAAWMTSRDNPWFTRAIVNRMWSLFIGRGLVDPVDDLRPSNPSTAPEVLDALATDFADSGFDLHHLVRVLTSLESYQLEARHPAGAPGDAALWSFHPLEPLPPDVLLDAVIAAGGLEPVLEEVTGADLMDLRGQLRRHYAFVFDVDEESHPETFDGTVPQALLLQNGPLVSGASSLVPRGALEEVLALPDRAARIEALYLRTLSRSPTAAEMARWSAFLDRPRQAVESSGPLAAARERKRKGVPADPLGRYARRVPSRATTAEQQAYEDLFWALVNSSEFVFNH